MRNAFVIGHPVAHSLSPALHNFWLKQYGIEAGYSAIDVAPESLEDFIHNIKNEGYVGGNVTLPHKVSVLPLMDALDEAAETIGAVNTIIVKDKKLHGVNTDAYGFIENIKQQHMLTNKDKAVLLGAGGAAKAVIHALLKEGFAQIMVTNRTKSKADDLQKQFGDKVVSVGWENRNSILVDTDLLVNTTSLGLKGNSELDIDLALLPETSIVCDIVYNPLMTSLLLQAKARGNPVVDGLGMLLHQAVPAFEAWFGVRPDVNTELGAYMLEQLV
ncbi:MAG: shikimate dehydrogenase [Rickettsiales bacterium]